MLEKIGEVLDYVIENRRKINELQRWRDYLDKSIDDIKERLKDIESR